MTDSVKRETEARLAKQHNQKLQDRLMDERKRYFLFAVSLFLFACGIAVVGLPMVALIAIVLGLICLLQYLDANGSLHEVQRRSTRTLMPDFSVLRQSERNTPSQKQPTAQ